MLPGLTLPASLLELLAVLRPCFTAPGFVTFCGLVAGLAGPGAAPCRGGHAAGRAACSICGHTEPGGSMTAAPRPGTSSATATALSPRPSWFTCRSVPREIGLPVLARLHLPGKGAGPGKVETAAALVSQLALAFPARLVHVVADAAYHGPALRTLPGNVTWTCRIPTSWAPARPATASSAPSSAQSRSPCSCTP